MGSFGHAATDTRTANAARAATCALRLLRAAVAIGCAAMLTACGAALTPSPARVSRDKIASIADWGMASMHDLPAGLYVQARSAILVQGANGVVGTGPGQPTGQPVGQPPTAMFWPTLDGAPVTRIQAGMAAAISDDGYWLTAAHCTDPEPLVLVRPTADGRLEHWPARVVWRAPSDGVTNVMDVAPYRDLAILHTRVDAPIPAFTLASSPPISGRVLCMGAGIATTRWSAGRVLGVEPSPAACVTLVRHDAPLFYGDSGGPAVLDDGTLVGVNVERVWGFLIPDWSVAAWLEPRVIRDVIEADRRARSSAEGSGVEGGRVEGGGVEGTGAQGDDAVAAGASRGP